MRVGSERHLLSSSRLEQAVYEQHPKVTTQMLTQMLLATVSLCVLCEITVRSRPCAQLLPQPATRMRRLMASQSELAPKNE